MHEVKKRELGVGIYQLLPTNGQIEISPRGRSEPSIVLGKGEVLLWDKDKIESLSPENKISIGINLNTKFLKISASDDRKLKISILSEENDDKREGKSDDFYVKIEPPGSKHALKVLHLGKDKVSICLHKKKGKNINVLAIDGGGIKGIIPAMVLKEMEKRIAPVAMSSGSDTTNSANKSDEENAPSELSDRFDLMAGTSTGAILVLGLSLMKSSALEALYTLRGREIFPDTYRKGLFRAKFNYEDMEELLKEHRNFGNNKLKDAKVDTIVTAYGLNNRKPFFFKSWAAEYQNIPMWQAIRATSGAPTYFAPAAKVQAGKNGANKQEIDMIDGGVFVNNPAVAAYVEAKRLFPAEPITLVSIGTGAINRQLSYDKLRPWGARKWFCLRKAKRYKKDSKYWRPLISVMLDGGNDAVDYQMRRLSEITGDKYFRLQVELKNASDDIDNASDKNISDLQKDAEKMMDDNRDEHGRKIIDEIIKAI